MNKIQKTIELAADIATEFYGITIEPKQILGKCRTRHFVVPRQICMYFLKVNYGKTFKAVGDVFGKDHSTAITSVAKVNDMIMINDEAYCTIYENMVKNCDLIENDTDAVYTVIFPKYADHQKLIQNLAKLYNIKTIKYERTFSDPFETPELLLHEPGHRAPVPDRKVHGC